MFFTCIYFADIGSFDGEEMSPPPHDLGVDPDDDQGMPNAKDHQDVSARCGQIDSRYQMELGKQLSELIVEADISPTHYRDIEVDDRLLHMWRGMLCDM